MIFRHGKAVSKKFGIIRERLIKSLDNVR